MTGFGDFNSLGMSGDLNWGAVSGGVNASQGGVPKVTVQGEIANGGTPLSYVQAQVESWESGGQPFPIYNSGEQLSGASSPQSSLSPSERRIQAGVRRRMEEGGEEGFVKEFSQNLSPRARKAIEKTPIKDFFYEGEEEEESDFNITPGLGERFQDFLEDSVARLEDRMDEKTTIRGKVGAVVSGIFLILGKQTLRPGKFLVMGAIKPGVEKGIGVLTEKVGEFKEDPKGTVKKVGGLALKKIKSLPKKVPYYRTGVMLTRIARRKQSLKQEEEFEEISLIDLKGHKYLTIHAKHGLRAQFLQDTADVIKLFTYTAPNVFKKLVLLPRAGMQAVVLFGGSLGAEATMVLGVLGMGSGILSVVVGLAGVGVGLIQLFRAGRKGLRLYQIHKAANQQEVEAKRLRQFAEEARTEEAKNFFALHADLLEEEARVMRDFIKREKLLVIKKAVQNTLFIAGNLSVVASGTCMIISMAGVTAPVTGPLAISFSALAVAIFVSEKATQIGFKIGVEKWDYDLKRQGPLGRENELQGVARSKTGVRMRLVALAKIEKELAKSWPSEEELEKSQISLPLATKNEQWDARDEARMRTVRPPTGVSHMLIERYTGKSVEYYSYKMKKKETKLRAKAMEAQSKGKNAPLYEDLAKALEGKPEYQLENYAFGVGMLQRIQEDKE